MSWISTYTGRKFHLSSSNGFDEFHLQDIAHALSLVCRYNGQCRKFYSVAEHSVIMTLFALKQGVPLSVCLATLLHDGSEAFLCDLPSPFKRDSLFAEAYKKVELLVQSRINRKYGLEAEAHRNHYTHALDGALLHAEKNQNMADIDWELDLPPALKVRIPCWDPETAETAFLNLICVLADNLSETRYGLLHLEVAEVSRLASSALTSLMAEVLRAPEPSICATTALQRPS